jgi:hypothetical protein
LIASYLPTAIAHAAAVALGQELLNWQRDKLCHLIFGGDMNFPSELQAELEQWATSADQLIIQVMSEQLTLLKHQRNDATDKHCPLDALSPRSQGSRLFRQQGVLVIEAGVQHGLDINAFVGEMREERIQGQIERVDW